MTAIPRGALIALAAAFSAYHVVRGLITLDVPADPVPSLVATAVYVVATVVVLLPYRGRSLPLWAATVALSAAIVVTLLVTSQLDPAGHLSYAPWHTNAVGTLMTVLVVRRRRLFASVGILFLVVHCTMWAGPVKAAEIGVTGALAWVVLAFVITGLLGRAQSDAEQMVSAEQESARWRATQEAHRSERRERIETASRVAGPLLREVVLAGGRLTDAEKTQARLLEARLRDDIRGRALIDDRVREAAWRARGEGVAVQLLDEGTIDSEPQAGLDRIRGRIAEAITGADADRIIVRTAPETSATAVTVVGLRQQAGADADDADVDLWVEISRTEADPAR